MVAMVTRNANNTHGAPFPAGGHLLPICRLSPYGILIDTAVVPDQDSLAVRRAWQL